MSLRSTRDGRAGGGRDPSANPGALASERQFLQRSIEDLEEQHATGEVDEADFAVLDARYADRLSQVEAAIADLAEASLRADPAIADGEGPDVPAGPRAGHVTQSKARRLRKRLGRSRTRLLVGTSAAACFVVAAALLAASLAGVRLPGESASGSVSLSSAQQERETLDRAAILGSEGQVAQAVQLYDQVLQKDPNQPDALAYGGWLVRLAGLSSKNRLVLARGDASVARAVKVAPGYPDGHALFGVILYEDFARPAAASVQFREALSSGASKNLLMSVAAIAAKAFAAANEPLPERYRAAVRSAAATATG